jgi:hypothetical protein
MKGKFWLALMALVAVAGVFAFIAVQGMTTRVGGGADGARGLETRLRVACGAVAAEEPPLRVFAMMPESEGGAWRWKVEATLRPGCSPADPATGRAMDRVLALCLTSAVGGKPPGGVLLVLHQPGRADWTRTSDGSGRVR